MVVVSAAVAATVAVPAVSGADTPAAVASPTAGDTAVLNQWNVLAQAEALLIRPSAHGQSRGIAMVQGAVYDAVNAIDRGYQPYLLDVEALDIDPQASYNAAIATAAHHVLVALVAADRVAALDAAYGATLAPIAEVPRDAGVAAGVAAAAAMLRLARETGTSPPSISGPMSARDQDNGIRRRWTPIHGWEAFVPSSSRVLTSSGHEDRTPCRVRPTPGTSTRSSCSARSEAPCAPLTKRQPRSSGSSHPPFSGTGWSKTSQRLTISTPSRRPG